MIFRQDEEANAYLGNFFAISMLRAVDYAPEWTRVRLTQRSRGRQWCKERNTANSGGNGDLQREREPVVGFPDAPRKATTGPHGPQLLLRACKIETVVDLYVLYPAIQPKCLCRDL